MLYRILMLVLLLPALCCAREWPDVDGILDFSRPFGIANRLFILTNPKSGSHLLLYSIMKITKRPLRGRVPLWYFENDPAFFPAENIMNYPLDFSKPTTYWGHEVHFLKKLNHRKNKLIFILRNYKENLSSLVTITAQRKGLKEFDLGELLLAEVLNQGTSFKEYLERLQVFDDWNSKYKCLVLFEDLVYHPEVFVPQVMSFINDDSEYMSFIKNYSEFKKELMKEYRKKEALSTGSGEDLQFFAKKVPKETFHAIDCFVKEKYPYLWDKYLSRYAEIFSN